MMRLFSINVLETKSLRVEPPFFVTKQDNTMEHGFLQRMEWVHYEYIFNGKTALKKLIQEYYPVITIHLMLFKQ